jgi:hypothetical protein
VTQGFWKWQAIGSVLVIPIATALVTWLPAGADTIQGGIEQSVSLPPVEAGLMQGNHFDQASLPPLHTNKEWYEIPRWYAGYWHRETQYTNRESVGPVSHLSRTNTFHGQQMDKAGHIWEAHDEPILSSIDAGNLIDYKLSRISEPVTINKQHVIMHRVDTDFQVDKQTGTIIRTYQMEQFTDTVCTTQGVLTTTVKAKRFDQVGKATVTSPETGGYSNELVAPFRPIYATQQRNYFVDFCQFLKDSGRPELMPSAKDQDTVSQTKSR